MRRLGLHPSVANFALLVCLLVFGLTHACRNPSPPVHDSQPLTQEVKVADFRAKPTDVKTLLRWQNKSFAEVVDTLGAKDAKTRDNAVYEKLTGVSELYYPAAFPGRFYFQDGKLAVLYIGDETYLSRLSPATIEGELGESGEWHRSREGKTFGLYVFPAHGFAYSSDGEAIGFVEVFPPMTLDEYRTTIYVDVGPFTK